MHLRCGNKLFGILVAEDVLEVKCDSKFCGHEPGTVVLHRFNLRTGDLVETKQYAEPRKGKEEQGDGASHQHPALRTP